MGEVFKTLTAGFSRFVMAWIVPSVTTLGLFAIFIYPLLNGSLLLEPIAKAARTGPIQASLVFAFGTVSVSLLFSLGSLPMYRLLEGYTLPRPLRRYWRRAEMRRRRKLQRLYDRL